MARTIKDLTGIQVGRLTVRWPVGQKRGRQVVWLCSCECGNLKLADRSHLLDGGTLSCGCLRNEHLKYFPTKHGHAKWRTRKDRSPEYKAWCSLRRRCNSKNDKRYCDYGGRGIRVASEWSDFAKFLADIGPRPSSEHSLDRIDNDGHYEPGNVRWATDSEQSRNRRKIKSLGNFTDAEILAEVERRKLYA